jgi:hypothetical protein
VREIRPLRVMWRELETGPGGISELPRQFPTLPSAIVVCRFLELMKFRLRIPENPSHVW